MERYLIGSAVRDKERLISAIVSNALLNEPVGFEQPGTIHIDKSLEMIGDSILDFVIIDNFATKDQYTAQQIEYFRQWYGNNVSSILRKIVSIYKITSSGIRMKENNKNGINRQR